MENIALKADEKVIDLKETLYVPDIRYIDLPPVLEMREDAMQRMDNLASAFGYTATTISDVYAFAKLSLLAAEHYRNEAERVRDSKRRGKEIERRDAAEGFIRQPWHKRLGDDIQLNRTIAVRGPAGNGKSTGVRTVLQELGFTIYHLDCTDTTSVEQLVGGLVPEPDGKGGIRMAFRAGLFAKAFADPNGAIQLDEFDALDPRAAMCLQSALHRSLKGEGRWLSLPDHDAGGIRSAGMCPVIVTMNTLGSGATREYVGRNALDAASMDRFNSVIETDYENEEAIIAAAGFAKAPAKQIVGHAKEIRKKIRENQLRGVVFSTRRLIDIAESVEAFDLSLEDAFNREFYERLESHDRKALQISISKKKAGASERELEIMPFEKMASEELVKFTTEAMRHITISQRDQLTGWMGLPHFYVDGSK